MVGKNPLKNTRVLSLKFSIFLLLIIKLYFINLKFNKWYKKINLPEKKKKKRSLIFFKFVFGLVFSRCFFVCQSCYLHTWHNKVNVRLNPNLLHWPAVKFVLQLLYHIVPLVASLYTYHTVCLRSLDPFYIDSKLLYELGQDFLGISMSVINNT